MKSALKPKSPTGSPDDVGWRQFPTFEEILGSEEPSPLMAKAGRTCRQLDKMLHSDLQADQERAQRAITAYVRSLDLLRLLTDMRDGSGARK